MAKTLWSFGHSECNRVKEREFASRGAYPLRFDLLQKGGNKSTLASPKSDFITLRDWNEFFRLFLEQTKILFFMEGEGREGGGGGVQSSSRVMVVCVL